MLTVEQDSFKSLSLDPTLALLCQQEEESPCIVGVGQQRPVISVESQAQAAKFETVVAVVSREPIVFVLELGLGPVKRKTVDNGA
jgi:hypothetical protein